MSKPAFIIIAVVASILGIGYIYSNQSPEFKAFLQKEGVMSAPTIKNPVNNNAVFVIFDPSGSGISTYSVPRITVEFVDQLIEAIAGKGKGDLWLTYISRSAYNTDVLHFEIPEKLKVLSKPQRMSGERQGEFNRRLEKYRKDSVHRVTEIKQSISVYDMRKRGFLKECEKMINNAYSPKKPGQDYSDIIGSLNTGLRVFSTIPSDSTHFRSILLISDGVQDVPKDDPHQTLKQIPPDIKCVEVNHGGSPKDILAGRALEMDNLDERVLDELINVYNAKNQ